MEVDTKPTEDYSDIGGLDKQIEELVEAIVLPMTHKERFINLGIKPPKGVLLYGPPGTGKSSLSSSIINYFGLNIYILSLSTINEANLKSLFNKLPSRYIILLKDINAMSLN